MKPVIACLLVFASVCSGGCSTPATPRSETDYDKAAQVERMAHRNGIQVHWVNYPTRVVSSGH